MSRSEALDATVTAAASKATYTGAGTATLGWLASSEFAVISGLVIGLLGLLTNWFFQMRRDRREEREHQRRMSQMHPTDRGGLDA